MSLLKKIIYASILLQLWQLDATGQSRYALSKLPFSSPNYDEFCPFLWEDSLIYCSNQEHEFLLTYHDGQNRALFNLFMVGLEQEKTGMKPSVLSPALVTPFNDGPAALSSDGTQLVYSRNLEVKARRRNVHKMNNHLGIYFAGLENGTWVHRGNFPYNNPEYSITSPCYSPDGRYLYFASDMPGGLGGTDLYRSEWKEGNWSEPVGLGSEINTGGYELYPFMAENGDLYFASDGHAGLGEKDIFLTRFDGENWIEPIHLEYPLNSEKDDFGLITNGDFTEGFLSSNREKSDDIYRFHTHIPQLFDCDTMLSNNYCYEFWDKEFPGIDTLPVIYEWMFSDGTKIQGLRVDHCFPGAGAHWAKLSIVDNRTSATFFVQSTLEFEITDHAQPYISTNEAGIVGQSMTFSGLQSNMPGFMIEQYIWDFGDGGFDEGSRAEHTYGQKGTYTVKLGLKGSVAGSKDQNIRCVRMPVRILADNQALAMYLEENELFMAQEADAEGEFQGGQQDIAVFSVDLEKEVYRVEVLTSKEKTQLENPIFNPLREQYKIKENFLAGDNLYSYTVGETADLVSSYEIFKDVLGKGFTSARVKTYLLAELPIEVADKINSDIAEFADASFDFNQTEISENSYHILDRVVKIMSENPDLAMEIAAHTDSMGSAEYNLQLSQKRAESIVNYLVSKGINALRLKGTGYGEGRPIASNMTEDGKIKNRRVEFIILTQ